jgi:hypothetical protein
VFWKYVGKKFGDNLERKETKFGEEEFIEDE